MSVYASWRPSAAADGGGAVYPGGGTAFGVVQPNTSAAMLEAAPTTSRPVYEAWEPFTAALVRLGSRFLRPRSRPERFASPYDLDGAEAITRFGTFPSSERAFPYPWQCGAISGFMPMMDTQSISFAFAKMPSGPGVGTPTPVPPRITYPDLAKVTG